MISIVITSFKEPVTIKKAITQMANQGIEDFEIIVCAPDKETRDSAKTALSRHSFPFKVLADPGKGKPLALNLALSKCKGEIVILTDGDVYVKSKVLPFILNKFKDPEIGAVSGRPVSSLSRKSLLGFWAEVLCTSFHNLRMYQLRKNKNIVCSGYFYAIRKKLFKPLPQETLADDAYVSFIIQSQGYKIAYSAEAEVYVKYPLTFADWVRQKKRTAGRVYQLHTTFGFSQGSSFLDEIRASLFGAKCISSLKEALWFFLLLGMKLYIWSRTLLDFRLRNRPLKEIWQRVETTK